MSEWRRVRLGDVAEEVTVGFVGPMSAEYCDDGVPFLRSQNITPHALDLSDVKYISSEFHERLSKSSLHPGDVVTVRTGKPGATAVIPEGFDRLNCADLVITRPGGQINGRWLSYYINTVAGGFISAQLVGAVQQHFNVGSAKGMEIILPGLPEQDVIAMIVGTLDDKIAAGHKIAASANQLASSLFTRAVSGIIESDLRFEDIANIGGGGTPRTEVPDYWGGSTLWATPTDVTGLSGPYLERTTRHISDAGLAACASPLYPAGSILMTSRATIGTFAVAANAMAVNQGFIVVNPYDEQLRWWLFHDMQSRVDEFLSHANGATFLELSRGKFKKLTVRLAEESDMRKFNADATALHDVARTALKESTLLAAFRGTLLPPLMSGNLRVRNAEKQVEEVL